MSKIHYKNLEEIEKIRESDLLVSKTLAEVAKIIGEGVKTIQLNILAEEFIRDHGGVPAFLNYNGFPYSLCISLNDQVVHGFPGEYEIKDGDIVSVDCGVVLNNFVGDSAYTFPIGNVDPETLRLLKVTKECLYLAIDKAVVGMRIGDIGYAVQEHAEKNGFGVVRELVGHGVGFKLHEKPEVPNYGRRGSGIKLEEGMVIAIEPMINGGKAGVKFWDDGWTVSTIDKKPSAHYEHSVAVKKGKADVLSTFQYIEEVLKQKD
ncbi:MAG: type I methionyl aminopeptidase [Sphingobacteriales bacterium 17-39-43]|uniref:type I methionyl aminopeptidase n=1 Tax=Daejeonella sp. TaxID=2805397 RepID=UPI000BDB5DD9|nr:type I methionyl aminopeptidase [Daejeonella sp.]OYZ28835.1 MAG: type I methionyl aminopeptidase [Sphingobacteriales bacterium 16-39-50]OZA22171.1 MAG: type I methionyl aminopeptidase [Sphingobacteriales bacterium 17-39-43]HQT24273.1 type I methionyl aminopeptidase [Daejeonella sp.]HQT59065.1 type I methionyl aminopeptidase [Daejeonella sp.]